MLIQIRALTSFLPVLKILSITQSQSNSDSGDEGHGGGSGWSADYSGGSSNGNGQNLRSSVNIEEEMDLQSGTLYSGPKGSKAGLINDVGWGYDCKQIRSSGFLVMADQPYSGKQTRRIRL